MIHVPGRTNTLFPFDKVGIIATDEQMQQFKTVFDSAKSVTPSHVDINDISLEKIIIDEHTRLKDQDIRSSGIRETTNGLVVGIERNQERILNPDSSTKFEWGDIVWIVGERKKIFEFTNKR